MSDVLNAVMSQYDTNTKPKQKKVKLTDEERLKRYFTTELPKNKETGQKTFRILPPKNGQSPFAQIFFHELKIDGKWQKLYCPKRNKTGECPLCEVSKSAEASGTKEDKEIASQYSARKFYIVKGIDRDLEEDGPKFWRFRHNFKKQGTLDKIVPVFSTKGDVTNKDKGRDIILTIGKDENGYTKVTSAMPEDPGPLSEDQELAQLWLDDESTWETVYAKKSYDYLEIIAQGEVPYWDKDSEKYISKTDFENKNSNGVSTETMSKDGETSAFAGGKKEVKEEAETVKSVEKTVTKPVAKAPVKAIVVQEDEDNEDSDVEMSDLPF